MTTEEQINKLIENNDSLRERVDRLDFYRQVAVAVALVFGVSGGYGAYFLNQLNRQIDAVSVKAASLDKQVGDGIDKIDEHVVEQKKKLDSYANDAIPKQTKSEIEQLQSAVARIRDAAVFNLDVIALRNQARKGQAGYVTGYVSIPETTAYGVPVPLKIAAAAADASTSFEYFTVEVSKTQSPKH